MADKTDITPAQVKAGRALLGWSQQDLAKNARLATSTVADFERGERTPVANNLDAMINALAEAGVTLVSGGAVTGQLPATVIAARADGAPIRWIDATDLSHWADRRDGQDTMPELISRLLRAELGPAAQLHFPSGESVQHPGWDGTCTTVQGTEHAPAGTSGWEIGAQRDRITKKADEDYEKRCAAPSASDPKNTTFVFVTPRNWDKKEAWVKLRQAEGKFAEVRAYDADDLVHWIEKHPSVSQWLATLMGKRPLGVQQLEEAWNEWTLSTRRPMSADLMLAGRDEQAAQVQRWLYAAPSVLAVQADSPNEAIAFLYASITPLPDSYRAYYHSKCLIAATPEVARFLGDGPAPLVIALTDADAGLASGLVKRGHHVYIAHASEVGTPDSVLRLPRAPRDLFAQALANMGLEQKEAEILAVDSARSLSVLRRLIASAPTWTIPPWAKPPHARALLPALLAGAWDEGNDGDRKFLERLAGTSYDVLIAQLAHWPDSPDAPFRKAGTAWKVAAPRDAWVLLAPYLTTADLDQFKTVAIEVLGSPDPRFELEPNERWLASIKGNRPVCSALLQSGIAQTLVLMGVFGKQAKNVADAEARSDAIVRELLENADKVRWWSLSGQFLVLAEASPDTVLNAIDDSLSQADPPIMALFHEDKGPLGAAYHSNLLFALEMLAWSPRYLPRVAELLAKLAQLDPEGRYTNRPKNSLRQIFLLWLPCTHASLEQRLRVIERLRKVSPSITWTLMLRLLPTGHDHSQYSQQARWRDLSAVDEEVSYALIAKGAETLSGWLIEDAGIDPTRWSQLIEHVPNLAASFRTPAMDKLATVEKDIADPKDRQQLRTTMRKLLHHHRSFPEADWALAKADLDAVERVYQQMEPSDVVEAYAWLFDGPSVPLPQPSEAGWEAQEEETKRLQRAVIDQILAESEAKDKIFALVRAVSGTALLGSLVAEALVESSDLNNILARALNDETVKNVGFAYGIIWVTHERRGAAWADQLLNRAKGESWAVETIVQVLLALPYSRETWIRSAALGEEIENLYWQKVGVFRTNTNDDDRVFALKKLLAAKRARSAVHLLGGQAKSYSGALLIEALQQASLEPAADDGNTNESGMFQWSVAQILNQLDEDNTVAEDQIARLEWIYLPLLEYSGRKPVVLHRILSSNPEQFVEVLSAAFRPEPGSNVVDEPETDPVRGRLIAGRAYDLLESWRHVPGLKDGQIDPAALEGWMKSTRLLCAKAGRSMVGDRQIGRMLASAPPGPDGVWPPAPVCDVIEICRSRDLEIGIIRGVQAKRGVTSRGLTDGGAQERTEAARYRQWSAATELNYPRTSAVLEQIAKSYDEMAVWHDQRAERTDWGH